MLFNSLPFLLFLPIVTVLYYLTQPRWRWFLLLVASCVFYMWFVPPYILILLVTIVIDYLAGIYMDRSQQTKVRKRWLVGSIIATCTVLFIFKYFGFFQETVIWLAARLGHPSDMKVANIILPIGLSFHTFQSMSYVIEVYRNKQQAERHFGYYALYVMFYPQLVTGPIERPQNLLRQLHEVKTFQWDNLRSGVQLILYGLFLKMVIADNLATYVNAVYAHAGQYSPLSVVTGLLFYSFQIYCDFFGYSTIALGCAKLMGYNITDNFQSPYLSRSIGEFWHRWHISLSTWFRDYVYIPLGGSRVPLRRWMINIMVVFLLSGLWHGAAWTFVAWGALHGLLLVAEGLYGRWTHRKDRIPRLWRIVPTFILVTLLWTVFRAEDFTQLADIARAILHPAGNGALLQVPLQVWLFLGLFLILDILLRNSRFDKWCTHFPPVYQWLICTLLAFSVIVFSNVESYPFIYFQF